MNPYAGAYAAPAYGSEKLITKGLKPYTGPVYEQTEAIIEGGEGIEKPLMQAPPLTSLDWGIMDYIYALVLLLVPWILFVGVYWVMSFKLHLTSASTCYFLVGVAGILVAITILGAVRESYKGGRSQAWAVSIAISMCIAFFLGIAVGGSNYKTYMLPYYSWSNLNTYHEVDPVGMGGEAFMDSGRVQFAAGSRLDTSKSAGFLNFDKFCVAPIVSKAGPKDNQVYDFWAAGTNCCSGNPNDFHCGDFMQKAASGGLRVLSESDRDFYRLAVQQAQASFGIQVKHPVFFHWVEDSNVALEEYEEQGSRNYSIGIIVHFVFQVLMVLTTMLVTGVLCRPKLDM